MSAVERCEVVVEALINLGLKPTPTNVNRALGREGRVKMNVLNGRETAARARVLEKRGWIFVISEKSWIGRWEPPNEVES